MLFRYMTIDKVKKINRKLIAILLLALVLRLWNLNTNPPSLSPDEASLGYNAYSILKTGKDEYGKFLPIIFKSFGDYKPGLYVYLTIPFVFIFGLNESSVRLPSALFAVLGIYLIYLIVDIFVKDKYFQGDKKLNAKSLPLVSAFLLALLPWHIFFSRGAWEVNVSLTLTLAAIYYFLRSLKEIKYLVVSSIFFSLTLLTYQGAKLSTTIVLFVLTVVFFKDCLNLFKNARKYLILSLISGLIIVSPIILSFFKGQTGRLTVFSVFSYPRPKDYIQKMLTENNERIGDLNYLLFHNETLNYKRAILGRYFNHFSARFLFFAGDYQNPKHSSPNQGMLAFYDLILLPLGIFQLVRQKGKYKRFIFLLLFLTPLPAVMTRDQVQAVRAYNMIIPLVLLSAFGFEKLLNLLKNLLKNSYRWGYLLSFITVSVFLGSYIYFLDSIFIHLPVHNAKYWNWGYKQVIGKLLPIQDKYKVIYFQQSYDQPYIYYLFYSRYDPSKYQKQAELSFYLGPDVGLVEKLDNIRFAGWSWPFATGEKSTLIIGNSVAIPSDFNPKEYNLISEIKYPDNFMTAFRILETK